MNKFFPFAGSSSKYASLIAEMIRREGYETYAEPMVGSGAVFFKLAPTVAFINDMEWLHTNLYWCARDNPEQVIEELDTVIPVKEWFLEMQEKILDIYTKEETAATWYAMLILCYNGIVKKRKGYPYLTWGDRYLTWEKRLPNYKQRLLVVGQMLQGAHITCGDYQLVPQADIAFFDPPWIGSDEDYGVDFDHPALADYLKNYPGRWVLTVNDHEQARELYLSVSSWRMELEPYYSVSPVKKGRFKRKELLITNFQPRMFG